MRFVSFKRGRVWRGGVLRDGTVVDLADALGEDCVSVRHALIRDREELSAAVDAALPEPGPTRLGPPVPDPDKIICLGLNYFDHAKEADMAVPEVPMFFPKYRNSLIGPRDEVVLPPGDHQIDYEAELAIVIGARCRGVHANDALECVAGLTCFNDVTARDLQFQTSQWGSGKAIDTFAPCGPAVVTLDELGDGSGLGIATRVNGVVLQDSSTDEMIFSVAEVVAYLSRTMTLVPGDLIATGTPAGVGFTREPPVLLNADDVVEVEIAGLGRLENRIVR